MTDKIIQYIKSVCKQNVMIDRIRTHLIRTSDDNDEKLQSVLTDLIDQNIIELVFDTCKIKETQGYTLTEDSQIESITLMVPETQNTPHVTSLTLPETQKSPELTF